MSKWVELKISQQRDKVICPCGATFENSIAGIREGQKHIANDECDGGEGKDG